MSKFASVVVVGLWVVMLGALTGRMAAPVLASTGPAIQVKEEDAWMGIYMEGNKVGYSHSEVHKMHDGYELTEDTHLSLYELGALQNITITEVSYTDASLSLRDFSFNMVSGAADMTINGVVKYPTLELQVLSAGTRREMNIPLTEPVHLSSDLGLLLEQEKLEVGKSFDLPFFDPSSMATLRMKMVVEAEETMKFGNEVVPVYRVRQEMAGAVVHSWINEEIGTLKSEGLMGFTFLMETKEQAMSSPDGGNTSPDIISLMSIGATGSLPEPQTATYMKASLDGVDLDGLDISSGRQELDGNVVTIRKEAISNLPHAEIPVVGERFAEYLAPTAMVQSDNPDIRAKSLEIVDGSTDALTAARRLSKWVFAAVDKRPSAGIPSAIEVFRSLRGDCNEHTVLYTAMARSVGIPTRMAAGIVMMDGRFYYHAWPEVYVGKWVSIDPTFDQFPADAAHIRLIEGGPEKQVVIVKLVGNLKVAILDHG